MQIFQQFQVEKIEISINLSGENNSEEGKIFLDGKTYPFLLIFLSFRIRRSRAWKLCSDSEGRANSVVARANDNPRLASTNEDKRSMRGKRREETRRTHRRNGNKS